MEIYLLIVVFVTAVILLLHGIIALLLDKGSSFAEFMGWTVFFFGIMYASFKLCKWYERYTRKQQEKREDDIFKNIVLEPPYYAFEKKDKKKTNSDTSINLS